MSHRYKEYSKRKMEIDKNQKKLEWLQRQDSVFVEATIDKKFKTLEKMRKCINYYVRKNTDNPKELITIEDTLLFFIAYCKLISTYSIAHLFNNDASAKKYIDAINRLNRKGYIQKSEKRDEHGKSYYLLTEEGKTLFEKNVNTNNLIPYSEWNFDKDGHAFHDAIVGSAYTRFLLLNMPFRYCTFQYIKKSNYKDDIIPDARAEILYYSQNKRVLFVEGNTGSEDVEDIITKIGKYHRKQFSTFCNHKFVFFVHEEKMKGFYREKFPGLFNGENPKQLKNVYKLLEYYDCTLDELIILMEKYFNSNRNDVISNTADGLKWDMFKLVTGEESDDFGDYKIMKCFLCSKAVRLLLSFDWIDRYILDMDNKSDIGKIQSLITYWEKNKYSNDIQNYIDCRKNIEDTRQERISLTKGIIDRYGRICDVIDMREALAGILGGVETIFVPVRICEMYIPFIMEKEAEILFQEKIKDMLEKKYGRRLSYFQVGAPFKTMRNVSDLYMRNCYYYIAEDNQPVEIYVENISASLSAMVRVVTLVCELLGVSLEKRNCTVICMVDSIRDMQLFIKLLEWANKRYNATTQLRIPVYFVLYDEIKEGKLLSYDSEHTR